MSGSTNKPKYLNPELRTRLVDAFGKRMVLSEKIGVRGEFGYSASERGGYSLAKKGVNVGEEHRVDCPFCGDTKKRLYINHLWGTKSKVTGSLTLWLAHCFNEECLTSFENRKELYDIVYGDGAVPVYLDPEASDGDQNEGIKAIKQPGALVRLDYLLRTRPMHVAVEWALARGYDPAYLAKYYDVAYCPVGSSAKSKASSRLVAPIYADVEGSQQLVAWTARKLVEDDPVPSKWVHSSGNIGRLLYNFEQARDYRTIVLTEGPGDAWAVGLNAVAMLGKTVQPIKAKLLQSEVSTRMPNDRVIVLLLDPAQDKVSKAKGLEHHMTKGVKVLVNTVTCPVMAVYLPQFADPGGLDQDFIWACIAKQAKQEGLRIYRRRKVFEETQD